MQLHQIIYNDLYKKIKSGYHKEQDMLPTEKKMEEIYGVSKAPVRQALAKLENQGLIERKSGKGTFVSRTEITNFKIALGGFTKQYINKWQDIRCKTIKVEEIKANADIQDKLSIDKDQKVIYTNRIRYLKDIPTYCLNHYSHRIDKDGVIEEGDFMSMRSIFMDRYGINIEYVSESLTTVNAGEELGKLLEVDEHFPLLKIDRISYNSEHEAVDYLQYYVRTDYWKYNVSFAKISNETVSY